MATRRERDEFDAPLEDITNDADAPPGRTEIGYQTEVIDKTDEEEMGMDDERFGIDDMGIEAVGHLHDDGAEGRSGTQTELGFDEGEDRGDFEDERDLRAAHMAREQAARGGGVGVLGTQTELGYLHDGGSEGRSGTQTELGYLTEGYEGQSGQQTEIGFLSKVKSWWHRLFGGGTTHVGNEEIGHGGGHGGGGHGGHGHGHGGGRGRGGFWGGGPWFDGPWYADGLEIDEIDEEDQPAVVLAVIEKARDNRMPAPKMVAVDPSAPPKDEASETALVGTCIGIAQATGVDATPLLTKLLQRFGAGGATRLVRVDTEESYAALRANDSPEMAELHEKIADLTQRLDEHIADPEAHEKEAFNYEELDDVVALGAKADAAEADKRIDIWLPKRFDGTWQAWREGNFVCASIALPGSDGEIRICTSMEPIVKCVEEMAHHASDAGVSTTAIGGVLPAMGCVLGAGTIMKEMAAAAPAILARPEAAHPEPFVVRIEPKGSPALAALAALAWECKNGNQQACAEWQLLSETGPVAVKQAMSEAIKLIKAA